MGGLRNFFDTRQSLVDLFLIDQWISDPMLYQSCAHGRHGSIKHMDKCPFFIQGLYIGQQFKIFAGPVVNHQIIFQVIVEVVNQFWRSLNKLILLQQLNNLMQSIKYYRIDLKISQVIKMKFITIINIIAKVED